MGNKTNPVGFRLGIIREWQAKWFAEREFATFLGEDLTVRRVIERTFPEAGIARVEISRQANDISVTIHTARPGIVIGRGGQRREELRQSLEKATGRKIRLNIQEIRQPELEAALVAKSIAEQLGRRIAFRRAMKGTMLRTMQAGAKGIKVECSGRLGGAEIARTEHMRQGQVPLHKIRADIDYGFTEAVTMMGRIGVKAWVYRGDILPAVKTVPLEAKTEQAGPETGVAEGKSDVTAKTSQVPQTA
ncbi:MAG: 30S ribosomal protein S3 [Dehalococcoidia bacterium]|nr:30S ribosomal protein S3 [Dehalococcoidia bacterium]